MELKWNKNEQEIIWDALKDLILSDHLSEV